MEEVILNRSGEDVPWAWMPEPQIYRDAISQQKCKMRTGEQDVKQPPQGQIL